METKPLAGLTKTVLVLLKIQLGLCAIAIVAGCFELYSYANLPNGLDINEIVLPAEAMTSIVGLVQLILFIILGIMFLRWIYRTNKNLHALSEESMTFSPGWSVGWYFIPIFNLFKPYQSMKEIWQVSHQSESISHTLLIWWWFAWLVSNMLGQIASKLTMRADDLSSYMVGTASFVVSDGLDIILNLVAIMLVSQIWDAYLQNFDRESPADNFRLLDDSISANYVKG